MRRLTAIAMAMGVAACGLVGCSDCPTALDWGELPPLPAAPGEIKNIGLAGPFAGLHNDALIVAGGANFPTPLLAGGKKVWWDDIFVLRKTEDGKRHRWVAGESFKLPRPLAYGVAVSTDQGVLCIGGGDSSQSYADCFMLSWDGASRKVTRKALPALPVRLAFMAGAKVGSVVYVVGGSSGRGATKSFFALDLSKQNDPAAFKWQVLVPWPGEARILPAVVAQSNGDNECLYLFSGRNGNGLLTDAYRYDPRGVMWTRIADVGTPVQDATCVMAAPSVPCGSEKIWILGGDTGENFVKLQAAEKHIATLKADPAKSAELAAAQVRRKEMLRAHRGFSRDILAYNTYDDTWTKAGEMPTGSHVTSQALIWDKAIIIVSGEIRPGVRSPKVLRARPAVPWYLRCWYCD